MNWEIKKDWSGVKLQYTFDGSENVPRWAYSAGDKITKTPKSMLVAWGMPMVEENEAALIANLQAVTCTGYEKGAIFSKPDLPVVALEYTATAKNVVSFSGYGKAFADDDPRYSVESKTEIWERSVFIDGKRGEWRPCGYSEREARNFGNWID